MAEIIFDILLKIFLDGQPKIQIGRMFGIAQKDHF
jgi:hypothetical protein